MSNGQTTQTENPNRPTFGWWDFETNEDEGDPDKFYLIIEEGGEEVCAFIHRTADGKYPLDGDVANDKRRKASRIAELLARHGWQD